MIFFTPQPDYSFIVDLHLAVAEHPLIVLIHKPLLP